MFCQILYKPKIFLAERGRPRYEFSATVLRRICKQWFPNKIEGMTRGGDEGKSFIFFRSFIYSLPTPQDCVFPMIKIVLRKCPAGF